MGKKEGRLELVLLSLILLIAPWSIILTQPNLACPSLEIKELKKGINKNRKIIKETIKGAKLFLKIFLISFL